MKKTKISSYDAHFGRKRNTPLSVISTKSELSNFYYENMINHYVDEDTGTLEAILPDVKMQNGYRSNIQVEKGMTRATKDANDREPNRTDGELKFFCTALFRSIPQSELAVQVKLARKVHGKRQRAMRNTSTRVTYFESEPYDIQHQRTRKGHRDCPH